MAITQPVGAQAIGATAKSATTEMRWVNWTALGIMIVGLFALYMVVRWYQQAFAWDYGMDSFDPQFQTYWMNLFYAEVGTISVVGALLWSWIWVTRDRHLDKLAPREELRRYFISIIWLAGYGFSAYFAASFFGEQDASWHQVAIRDTDFTPSHVVVFYGMFPLFLVIGIGGWLWARTRLPIYSKGFPIAYTIAVSGPFMILPNIGFNEFGHTFWFMEELFSHPLHYGFVIFGWSALALGGVLTQYVKRFNELTRGVNYGAKNEHSY